ncbi:hypothetical protein Ccar_19065 [Clostridium carboxidivorans P7]|uniref:Uncharacterized protein n=1 Tax=Clostridium carboxidivorans P7 TaxID=536227 RepID=C6PNP1_9CLOT|nr:hypothetical protein [Clostridium carboxidivorans]AKN32830.1 hypothetical protein Ccar_19065 [Clostridium carboxidivorans P7]EET89168.1 conserved hypothetical protein [Clostridium carboxidivorans P7]EFG89927.1 hypothetical protein CLCAR_0120 [Clostridium carboxidivorans P7]
MISLDFAVLKHFTKVKEACAQDITNALKDEYDSFKELNKGSVMMTLITAEAFGAIEKTKFQLDENGEINVYYRAQEGDAANLIYKSN